MKRIIKIIFISFFVYITVAAFLNIEEISNQTIKFFTIVKEVKLPDSNEYKRNYEYKTFTISNNFEPSNKDDIKNIYFNILNNGWDSIKFYCPTEYTSCIDDIREIGSDSTLLSKINNYVSPFNSYIDLETLVNKVGEVTINVKKNYSQEDIENINFNLNKILMNLNIDSMSDTDKLRTIKNYLIENTTYNSNFDINSLNKNDPSTKANGVFDKKSAICSGYSDAFALFLDRLNIPNIKISSENHIWNLVYIDETWTHIDVTWSDTDGIIDLKDRYFMITTEKLKSYGDEQHVFDETFFTEAN